MRVVSLAHEEDFDGWRAAARSLAIAGVPANDVTWQVGETPQDLFAGDTVVSSGAAPPFSVPRPFVELARSVVCHQDPERFSLLYMLLLRLRQKPRALEDSADPLVRKLELMAKEVRRDMHKMHAFVRFREMEAGEEARETQMVKASRDGNERAGIGDNALAAWEALREEARGCTRCHLYKCATQTVFGEGPVDAPLMFVGEQPGDQEDLAGRPFVGPAGQLWNQALGEAGIDREQAYVTNAVKHFKFERRGTRRIHQKPEGAEIEACRWWIEQEQMILRPRIVVALGATAARSLFGRVVTISSMRARAHPLADGGEAWVTVHPSFLLRVPDNKEQEYARFVKDLVQIRKRLEALK